MQIRICIGAVMPEIDANCLFRLKFIVFVFFWFRCSPIILSNSIRIDSPAVPRTCRSIARVPYFVLAFEDVCETDQVKYFIFCAFAYGTAQGEAASSVSYCAGTWEFVFRSHMSICRSRELVQEYQENNSLNMIRSFLS